ncbi:MAG: AhpC/TSA family protein [Verrucomicrobia bacterium]|nr:AhpC/TSA family protein [Verrucomicrobiota bacterium]MCH8527699.1 AhpC/TSA family protein [Kiritimatiellia bacterium]
MKYLLSLYSLCFALNLSAEPIGKGAALPDAEVRRADGEAVSLAKLTRDQKTVLVFYRGGWCPFCNTQLAALVEIEDELRENGWRILAVSPDRPEIVKEAKKESDYPYLLVSDSDMNAAKAFGLAFTVDEEGFDRLKGFGIDLEAASGKTHRMLPVPAVFLVDAEGEIVFAHHDPDYRKRLSNEAILQAAAE